MGEELVQEEGLLTSQQEHRLSETGPTSTDLYIHEMRDRKVTTKVKPLTV